MKLKNIIMQIIMNVVPLSMVALGLLGLHVSSSYGILGGHEDLAVVFSSLTFTMVSGLWALLGIRDLKIGPKNVLVEE